MTTDHLLPLPALPKPLSGSASPLPSAGSPPAPSPFVHDAAHQSSAAVGPCDDIANPAKRYADDDRHADDPIDPSLVAGLTLLYGHRLKGRGLYLPLALGRALAVLVETGDPTAQIVWEWCLEHNLIGDVGTSAGVETEPKPGLVPAPPPSSLSLRLVTTAAVRP